MLINILTRCNTCGMNGVCIGTRDRLHRTMDPYPCFAAAFNFLDEHPNERFDITYRLLIKKECDEVNNNFALVSKTDMCRLLNAFKYIIPFTYHFEEYSQNRWKLVMHLVGERLQHKGLLMLSRMLFEYPHNMCGMDALHLRDLGKVDGIDFSKIPLINLYFLCISSTYFSIDECFIKQHNPEFLPMDDLKSRLLRRNRKRISLIIPYKHYQAVIKSAPKTMEIMKSAEDFERRLHIYVENYKMNADA